MDQNICVQASGWWNQSWGFCTKRHQCWWICDLWLQVRSSAYFSFLIVLPLITFNHKRYLSWSAMIDFLIVSRLSILWKGGFGVHVGILSLVQMWNAVVELPTAGVQLERGLTATELSPDAVISASSGVFSKSVHLYSHNLHPYLMVWEHRRSNRVHGEHHNDKLHGVPL